MLGRASPVFHSRDLIPFESRNADASAWYGPPPMPAEYAVEVGTAEAQLRNDPDLVFLAEEPLGLAVVVDDDVVLLECVSVVMGK